jgi:phage-related protein
MSDGFTPRAETFVSGRAYVSINGTNLDTTYGLGLTDYSVGSPSPLLKLIDVPGRPGKLDVTLALNGKVNYTTRPVTAEFHVRNNPYPDFHTLLSNLLALFNGTESKMVFSTDPDWYYKGQFTIDAKKTNPVSSTIVIKCDDAFPYKLEEYMNTKTLNSPGSLVCVGKDYNGTVTINVSVAMSVTFKSSTYQLVSGDNVIREIHIAKGNNTLFFSSAGTVSVTYERGVL